MAIPPRLPLPSSRGGGGTLGTIVSGLGPLAGLLGGGGGSSSSATGGSVNFNPAISVNVGSGDLSSGAEGYQTGSSSQAQATPAFVGQGSYPGSQAYDPRYSINQPLPQAQDAMLGGGLSGLFDDPLPLLLLAGGAFFLLSGGE